MRASEEKYVYTVTLNEVQSAILEGLVGLGIYGRNASDVIRRILDGEFSKFVEMPRVDLLKLIK